MKKLVTNPKWCKGCGICVAFCPKEVLSVKKEKIVKKDGADKEEKKEEKAEKETKKEKKAKKSA